MSQRLFRITYFSVATRPFRPQELDELLVKARSNNAAVGVTGMLLYHDRNFLQTLEGPKEAVDAVYSRILCDQRHCSVVTAVRDDTDKRLFGDWAMGWANPSMLSEGLQTDLAALRNMVCKQTSDPGLRVLMTSFLRGVRDCSIAA